MYFPQEFEDLLRVRTTMMVKKAWVLASVWIVGTCFSRKLGFCAFGRPDVFGFPLPAIAVLHCLEVHLGAHMMTIRTLD